MKRILIVFAVCLATWLVRSVMAFQPLFDAPLNYPTGDGPHSVFAADFDGDSNSDLAVANYQSDNVSILLNNGDGTFQSAVNYGAGEYPWSVFASDLDGDSDNDLAVANAYSHDVSILLNNGDGTFQSTADYRVGEEPVSVFASDLDGDSDNDLAVANYLSHNVSILTNLTAEAGIVCFRRPAPGGLELSRSHPNPFNTVTHMQLAIPEDQEISVRIYNVAGQLVTEIRDGRMEAGYHTLRWGGRGSDGQPVATGVYYCRMIAGEVRQTRKMLVLR